MDKDVIVTITGIQNEYERENPISQIVPGQYYFRNGKHFFVYEEIADAEDGMGINKCVIKASPEHVQIIKRGKSSVQMNFIKNKKTITAYPSPFGFIMTGFNTHRIAILKERDKMEIELDYEMEMNGSFISDCEIIVKAESKNPQA